MSQIILTVLSPVLNKYFENFNDFEIVGALSPTITLSNVKVKQSVLELAEMPFELVDSSIDKIKIHIDPGYYAICCSCKTIIVETL